MSAVDENTLLDLKRRLEPYLQKLNPEQRLAAEAPISQNTQVLAGAGTGKTYMMTVRAMVLLVALMEAGHPNPSEALWIATFTERAAGELRERLEAMYRDITGQALPKSLWIGTFHSLSNRLLALFLDNTATETHILQDLDLLIVQEELVTLLLNETQDSINTLLNISTPCRVHLEALLDDWQLTSAEELVNEMIMSLVPRIKAAGLSPQQFETLAKQQSFDLMRHIQALPLSERPDGSMFETVEAAATTWQNYFKPYATPGFQFAPTAPKLELEALKAAEKGKKPDSDASLLKKHVRPLSICKRGFEYNGRGKIPYTRIQDTAADNNRRQQDVLTLARNEALIELTAWIYRVYQARLKAEEAFDFDDLILETLAQFETQPDKATQLTTAFKHVLIDEFQDTNGSQLSLIQALTQEQTPVTVVGDMKQSIYGFRFAQPENLDTIFIGRDNVAKITLKTNYRSTPRIIRVANRASYFVTSQSGDAKAELYPNPETSQEDGPDIVWTTLQDNPHDSNGWSLETQLIADKIDGWVKQDGLSPKDIAVLFPSHQKGVELEAALRARQIPAYRQKALGFFDSKLMNALVSLLLWLANAQDDMAMAHLLQLHLSDGELLALGQARRAMRQDSDDELPSYYDALCAETTPRNDAMNAARELFMALQKELSNAMPHDVIAALIKNPAVFGALIPSEWWQDESENLQHVLVMLSHWAKGTRRPRSQNEVLDCLKRAQAKNEITLPINTDITASLEAVMLLTIHASKGLEFQRVCLAGVENYRPRGQTQQLVFEPQFKPKAGFGLFLRKSQGEDTLQQTLYKLVWESPRLLNERLRLQYVAMTRAKEELHIYTGPKSFPYMHPKLFADVIREEAIGSYNTPSQPDVVLPSLM